MASHDELLAQVRRANERFYRAFESLDIAQMEALWVHAERAKCVHPGWDMLAGWESIRASWAAIFASTDTMRFVLTEVAVHLYGSLAWVTCVENLSDDPDIPTMVRLLATNIYEHSGDDWLLVHHHASAIMRPTSPAAGLDPDTLN